MFLKKYNFAIFMLGVWVHLCTVCANFSPNAGNVHLRVWIRYGSVNVTQPEKYMNLRVDFDASTKNKNVYEIKTVEARAAEAKARVRRASLFTLKAWKWRTISLANAAGNGVPKSPR